MNRVLQQHAAWVRSHHITGGIQEVGFDLEQATPKERLDMFLNLYEQACGENAITDEKKRSKIAAAALLLASKYPGIGATYDSRHANPGGTSFFAREAELKKALHLSEQMKVTWEAIKQRVQDWREELGKD